MKWKRWILTGTLFAMFIPVKAYAGNINGNEQSVLAVAGGTFEYKGVTYRATPEHLAEAKAKLLQDDVDLTKEQAQEAIASIYANVQTGIEEGYIVPISGSGNINEEEDSSRNQETGTVKEDDRTSQNSAAGGKTETNQNTGVSQNIENADSNVQMVQAEEVKTPEQLEWEKVELPKLKKQKTDIIADNFVEAAETTEWLSDSNIIKDTGYNLSGSWIVPTIFLTGIGVCAMCIKKYHLLAHNHES